MLDMQLLAIKKEQEQTHKEIEALKATRAAVTHQKVRPSHPSPILRLPSSSPPLLIIQI